MFKRLFVAVTILLSTLSFMACGVQAGKSEQWIIYWYACGTDIETTRIAFGPETDLMTGEPFVLAEANRYPGDVSRSIAEIDKAELSSPNVKIFMQAGGTFIWAHEKFRDNNAKFDMKTISVNKDEAANHWFIEDGFFQDETTGEIKRTLTPAENGTLSRYLYDKDHRDWTARERLPISGKANSETDMGSKVGLVSFLKAGQELERELYPDGNVRRIFIFVDHGQGSINHSQFGGVVCRDEYTNNMLSLKDLQEAFAQVKDGWKNPNEKPFEVVAFDTCLMSTYETAVALEDVANYMVASQEVTYGVVMFDYGNIISTLSKNPSMSGEQFGKLICDTCWEKSKVADAKFNMNTSAVLTESVIDLSKAKMNALKNAYDNFGKAALDFTRKNPDELIYNFTKFKKAARVAEKYPCEYYFSQDMVDLRGFALNVKQNIPQLNQAASNLVAAIDTGTVYKTRGELLKNGGGLSTYYPLDLISDGKNIAAYKKLAKEKFAPDAQSKLYGFFYDKIKRNSNDLSNLKSVPVEVDENKKVAQIKLDAQDLKRIEDVRCQMIRLAVSSDENGNEKLQGLFFGEDSDMKEDWMNGIFESSFRENWISLDNKLLFVRIVSDSTVKNEDGKKIGGSELYLSPILLNGKNYKLFFSCNYPDEKVTLIGATPNEDWKIDLPSGELESLDPGDVVTPLYLSFELTEKELEKIFDEPTDQKPFTKKLTQASSITITENTILGKSFFPDGKYFYVFEFVNPLGAGNETTNSGAVFTVKDCKVIDAKHMDDIEKLNELKN